MYLYASVLKVHPSTIGRELKRNCDQRSGIYKEELAQRKAEKRQAEKPRYCKFTEEMKQYVTTRLKNDLSPEQIAGRAKLEGIDCVSHEWMIAKLDDKSAKQVEEKTVFLLSKLKNYIHTITSDNGREFANHQQISNKLNLGFYFAHPYSSWERGCNENTNGLIRQYLPKKTSFQSISNQEIKQ